MTGPRDGSMTGSFQGLVVDMKYPSGTVFMVFAWYVDWWVRGSYFQEQMCQREPRGMERLTFDPLTRRGEPLRNFKKPSPQTKRSQKRWVTVLGCPAGTDRFTIRSS